MPTFRAANSVAFLHLAPAYTNQPQTPSSEKWKRRELFPIQQHPTNAGDVSPTGGWVMKMNDTGQLPYWWTASLALFSALSLQEYIFIIGALISAWFTIKTYYANRREKAAQIKEQQDRTQILKDYLQGKPIGSHPEAIQVVNEALQQMESE